MRIAIIVLLSLLLSMTVGSHITRVEFEVAAKQCEAHGGLVSLETNTFMDGEISVAHCQDGVGVKHQSKNRK